VHGLHGILALDLDERLDYDRAFMAVDEPDEGANDPDDIDETELASMVALHDPLGP
jgi:hypothetical protein